MSTADTWTDSTGEWLTASNWSDGLPNANSAVTIDISGGGTVSYDPGTQSEPAIFSLQTNTAVLDVVSGTLNILDGDSLVMAAPLINTGTFELSGGPLTISSEVTNSGSIIVASTSSATASLLFASFDPNAVGTIAIGAHGIGQFGAVPAAQSVTLTASTAKLLLDDSTAFNAAISGFAPGNTIDFPSVQYAPTDTLVFSPLPGGGRVTIDNSNSVEVATVLLTGKYSQAQFQIGEAADMSLELVLSPCYAAGTRIATPRGEIAVEALRVGDAVLTAAGEAKPIVWIGQRRVDCRRHPRPELVLPVRVHAGAFGEGLPRRDLLLSPDHAVFADGVLVPIKYLVNDLSIAQESAERARYFHIELERHDVLLAEGLPAESYLDTGNRAQFERGAAHVTLHPDFAPLSWDDACAPLCVQGPLLAEMRRRLADRAAALGYLEVFADAAPVRAAGQRGRMHRFLLPPGTRAVSVRSRTGLRIGGIFAGGRPAPLERALSGRQCRPAQRAGMQSSHVLRGRLRLALPGTPLRNERTLLEICVFGSADDRQSAQSGAGDRAA